MSCVCFELIYVSLTCIDEALNPYLW